jgi:hypothetical protein
MMSAIAPVVARLGGWKGEKQSCGQPSSYCGQSPCITQPKSSDASHCGDPRSSPSRAHQLADQLSDST